MPGADRSEVVRRYLDALNRQDVPGVLACVGTDFVNEHTAVGGRSRVGRAAYAAALPVFLADFIDLHYQPQRFVRDGPDVAVPYLMSFRHRLSAGAPVRIRGVFIFTLDGDPELIVHRVDYWDSGQLPWNAGS